MNKDTMKKRVVLLLALQFNFLIALDTYLYAMSANKQIARVVELQFIVYMV
jgi:hypothetical protein